MNWHFAALFCFWQHQVIQNQNQTIVLFVTNGSSSVGLSLLYGIKTIHDLSHGIPQPITIHFMIMMTQDFSCARHLILWPGVSNKATLLSFVTMGLEVGSHDLELLWTFVGHISLHAFTWNSLSNKYYCNLMWMKYKHISTTRDTWQ